MSSHNQKRAQFSEFRCLGEVLVVVVLLLMLALVVMVLC